MEKKPRFPEEAVRVEILTLTLTVHVIIGIGYALRPIPWRYMDPKGHKTCSRTQALKSARRPSSPCPPSCSARVTTYNRVQGIPASILCQRRDAIPQRARSDHDVVLVAQMPGLVFYRAQGLWFGVQGFVSIGFRT